MRVLLAIPVFNEVRSVEAVLREARRYARDILVVDDGSSDGTSDVLRAIPGIRVLCHEQNRGYGQALIDAFHYAIEHGYDWVITMDCDGQHEPAFIPEFAAAAAADDSDIISGSRYLEHMRTEGSPPADRRAINGEITELLNRELGLGLTDAFCGFKAYRVACLRCLDLTEPGYAMPLQLWVRAACRGLRVRELPIRLIYNDPNRSFGGRLDDPEYRRRHYLRVYRAAMEQDSPRLKRCRLRNAEACSRC